MVKLRRMQMGHSVPKTSFEFELCFYISASKLYIYNAGWMKMVIQQIKSEMQHNDGLDGQKYMLQYGMG